MEVVIYVLKVYLLVFIAIVLLYMLRHFIFTFNRLFGRQKLYYQDILDDEVPFVTVLVPMHNEALVANQIMDRLMESDYPLDRLEIIPINDHSEDETKEIIDTYALKYAHVKPLHRLGDEHRGKANSLNDAMPLAKGEVIVVFDADYQPPNGIIRELAVGFKDPEVGAVMGRVLVENCGTNMLTMMLELERSGGYQVDQQARYNLNLIPQYGGTVGAYRKNLLIDMGGFDPNVLAEDTELTYKMYLNGWQVAYANRAECYEEMPENWMARAKQIRRWARGHNQVMFRYLVPLLSSKYLNFRKKVDGLLLIFIYMMPTMLFFGILSSLILFLSGNLEIFAGIVFLLFIVSLGAFGNFAPFFQIGVANFIDGRIKSLRLIPLFAFNFVFYMLYVSLGFWDALIDIFRKSEPLWSKTERHAKKGVKDA
ncbi:MAG TPA: glycosyltransferase family 2 protein [Sulfurovum sp.]|nr:glycosyltransferase family 2 protein [Sulfurovum sp.]HIQ27084.1 glycosyltransferase family 2 protein [Sulfurovum sp.]